MSQSERRRWAEQGIVETFPVTAQQTNRVMYCTTHGTSDHSGLGKYAGCVWESRTVDTVGYPEALNDGEPRRYREFPASNPLPPSGAYCVTHQSKGVHYNGDRPCAWQKPSGPPKGTPNRRLIQRGLFMLDDFSDAECRVVLKRLTETAPQPTTAAICEHWELTIESGQRELKRPDE